MIAICTLGYGHADYTQRFLDSVKRNSGDHDIALYLIDNGSHGDGETTRVMQAASPRFFERWEDEHNIHKPWNRLLRQAVDDGADIICLTNNDVVVGPHWLDGIVREQKPMHYFMPNASLYDQSLCPDRGRRLRRRMRHEYHLVVIDRFEALTRQALLDAPATTLPGRENWCMFFTPAAVNSFWPIPEELQIWCGDTWLQWRLRQQGFVFKVVADCFVLHFANTTSRNAVGWYASDYEIFRRLTGQMTDREHAEWRRAHQDLLD